MSIFSKIVLSLLLAILPCLAAGADQVGRHIFGGVGDVNTPGWVLSGASIDLDFANGLYFGCATPPTDCLSITRASNATDLVPASASGYAYNTYGSNAMAISPTFGLYIFEARTNFLLNSAAPATQTTGSLANGTYTLWVNGSGTATMSAGTATGCGTGAASQGTPVNFTTSGTAGTCVVTVGGSLNAFQLELGSFGTSFIVTTGATATRAADVLRPINAAFTLADAITSSIVSNIATFGTTTAMVNGTNNGAEFKSFWSNTTTVVSTMNGVALNATIGASQSAKIGVASDPSGHSLVGNNGTVTSDANTWISPGNAAIGSTGVSLWLNGPLRRQTYFGLRIGNVALKALTQ